MTPVGRLSRVVFAVGLAVFLPPVLASVAGQAVPDIAVVVHPEVPFDNLTRADLRRILLGEQDSWPSGVPVKLLLRAPISRERDAAVRDVCGMSEAQFRQHWIAIVFRTNTATAPKIVYSDELALDLVSQTPGALAFLETPITGKNVKVLKIDGKMPGQPGYSLK